MNSEQSRENINWKYLSGQMSEAELLKFRETLAQDEATQEKLAEEIVRQQGRMDVKSRLQKVIAESPGKVVEMPRLKPNWMMAAAIAVLLISTLLYSQWYMNEPEDMLASVRDKATGSKNSSTLEAIEQEEKIWQEAILKYEAGEYEEAIVRLKKLLALKSSKEYVYRFYLGMSYLKGDPAQPELALAELRAVSAYNDKLRADAQWAMVQAFTEMEMTDSVKVYAKELLSDPKFSTKADSVLKAISP